MVWKTARRLRRLLGFELVEDRRDVTIVRAMLGQTQVGLVGRRCRELATEGLEVAVLDVPLVAVEGVLGLGRRFPLVAPDHVEPGAIEGEMEASDSREQLRDGRAATGLTTGHRVVCGHGNPSCYGAGEARSKCIRIGVPWDQASDRRRDSFSVTQPSASTPKSRSPVDWRKPSGVSVIDTSSRSGQFGS